MSEQHDARPDDAPAVPDDRPPAAVCRFLGRADDPAAHDGAPSSEHRCRAAGTPVYVELAHQGTYCLTSRHVSCPRYSGPDATATGEALPAPAPPATADADPPSPQTQPQPAARASYTLAARGGFGALASTPRGWVPVETSSATSAMPAAVTAAAGSAEPPDDPASEPAPEPEPDLEGLGALVAVGATDAVTVPRPVAAADGAMDAAAAEDAPAIDVDVDAAVARDAAPVADKDADAAPAVLPSAGAISAAGAAEGVATLEGAAATSAPEIVDGQAALEGPAAEPGIGSRLAAVGRHLLRGLAILLAAVLVLVALVGLGYVAGKMLVRPGGPLPSAAPATPLVTPPGPGSSQAPGAGAVTAPPVPVASATPVESTPAAATARPTPTAEPTPTPTPKPRVYVVKSGDTLFAIAERFGVTVGAIIEANDIADPNAIIPGQRLTIPRP